MTNNKMNFKRAGLALASVLAIASCAKSGESTDGGSKATLTITFPVTTVRLFQTIATTTTPTISGGSATGCTSSPELPAGLTISATTCAITGTPTATQATSTYTISATGTNAAGSTTISLMVKSLSANGVYGQAGSYTTAVSNNGGLSASSLSTPVAVMPDGNGVYIADSSNKRVLYFPGTSTTATRVYGQLGSFTTNTLNNGGVTANSLGATTYTVMPDSTGVYIVDNWNNRVLYFSGTSTTASRVYGQLGSFTTSTANNGGVSADSLSGPQAVFVETNGIYIADTSNFRVLHYTGTSTTADRVYGQAGQFTTNNSGVSASELNTPKGLFADSTGLYVSDSGNNRVLFFAGTTTTASRVYGQPDFTSNASNNGGRTASTMGQPFGIVAVSDGVFISDFTNRRVLYYPGTSTVATGVYGQGGSFTTATAATTQSGLSQPYHIAVSGETLMIADGGNERVLLFP